MSNGGFTAFTPNNLRKAQTTKNPSQVSTGDGFFWNSFCNQIRNSNPEGPLLIGGATTRLCGCHGYSSGGEYRRRFLVASRLLT
jgi:hypothetical protein